jgi:hypothetical protein
MEILPIEIPFTLGVPLQYIYGLMMIPLFLIWLFLFYKYPRYRKAMLIGFIVTGTVGHVSQYMMYRHDWFRMLGIFGTDWTPIEDLIIAGTNSGIVFLAWPILTGQNFKEQKEFNLSTGLKLAAFWLVMFLIPYYLWTIGVHSYTVEWTVYTVFIVAVLISRTDLIIKSLVSSVLITLGTIPFYIIIQFLVEDFATRHYFFEELSGTTFLNIPVEDYIWYLFVNVLLSVFYHYIFESKFEDSKVNLKNSLKSIRSLLSLKKNE